MSCERLSCRGRSLMPGTVLPFLLVVASLATSACGKKGDPLPPFRNVPMRIADLTVRQEGPQLQFEMGYPQTTAGGLALGGVDSVELLELTKPAPGGILPKVEPAEFEGAAEVLVTLRGAELDAALTGQRLQLRLPLAEELPEDTPAHFYAVRTGKQEELSDLSNLVGLVPVTPPTPPGALAAEALAGAIVLRWESDDAEGFDVFRREAAVRGYGKPLGRAGGEEREYRDSSATYGHRYIYTVRAVVSTDPLIYSAPAGEREIDYEDRFPPPPPGGFAALSERGAVRLRWNRSRSRDVAGYILFRREPGREFHRLNEELIDDVEYLDRGLASGLSYDYRIQAVDEVGNESRPSRVVSATAR